MNEQNTHGWNMNRAQDYASFLARAHDSDELFEKFKSDSNCLRIVERSALSSGWVNNSVGHIDFLINNKSPVLNYVDAFRINDQLGSPPALHDYGTVDGHLIGEFTPTTVNYMRNLHEYITMFGPLDGFDIVEIGGGYGGEALVVSQMFDISSHTIVDLFDAGKLQEKYLAANNFRPKLHTASPEVVGSLPHDSFDLLISNWAFTEVDIPQQDVYLQHVASKSKRGFILSNFNFGHSRGDAHRVVTVLRYLGILSAKYMQLDTVDANIRAADGNPLHIIFWDETA